MLTLLIIDGLGLLFRSFYAMSTMTNANGENVGGIYGFVKQVRKLVQAKNPSHVIVALDTGSKTWRHDAMVEYKAHRKASPPELRHQFQWMRDACVAMNITYVEHPKYEADDICAAYAAQYRHEHKVCIASVDKDLMQLVQHNVTMYDPFKRIDIDEYEVMQRFCVRPDQIVDFLSMVGDASDGIAGVTGVGPKTAAKWLNLYNDIDGIMHNILSLTPSRLANMLHNEYDILQNAKNLITLRTDIDLPTLGRPMQHNIDNIQAFYAKIGIMQNNI